MLLWAVVLDALTQHSKCSKQWPYRSTVVAKMLSCLWWLMSGVVSAIKAQALHWLMFFTMTYLTILLIISIMLFRVRLLRNVSFEPCPFAFFTLLRFPLTINPVDFSDPCCWRTFSRWLWMVVSCMERNSSNTIKFPVLLELVRDSQWPLRASPCFPSKTIASTTHFISFLLDITSLFLWLVSPKQKQYFSNLCICVCCWHLVFFSSWRNLRKWRLFLRFDSCAHLWIKHQWKEGKLCKTSSLSLTNVKSTCEQYLDFTPLIFFLDRRFDRLGFISIKFPFSSKVKFKLTTVAGWNAPLISSTTLCSFKGNLYEKFSLERWGSFSCVCSFELLLLQYLLYYQLYLLWYLYLSIPGHVD